MPGLELRFLRHASRPEQSLWRISWYLIGEIPTPLIVPIAVPHQPGCRPALIRNVAGRHFDLALRAHDRCPKLATGMALTVEGNAAVGILRTPSGVFTGKIHRSGIATSSDYRDAIRPGSVVPACRSLLVNTRSGLAVGLADMVEGDPARCAFLIPTDPPRAKSPRNPVGPV